jgi:hypothetical protein
MKLEYNEVMKEYKKVRLEEAKIRGINFLLHYFKNGRSEFSMWYEKEKDKSVKNYEVVCIVDKELNENKPYFNCKYKRYGSDGTYETSSVKTFLKKNIKELHGFIYNHEHKKSHEFYFDELSSSLIGFDDEDQWTMTQRFDD